MNELTIPIDLNSKLHIYEQIYEYIRNEILEGRLTQGERLPSSRALATHLQISRSTVNLAYEQLLAEGYLEAFRGKGYFVTKIETVLHMGKEKVEQVQSEAGESRYRYHFTPNGIDMSEFPYQTWRRISKEVLNSGRKELFSLGHPQGDLNLREIIAQYLFAARGVICRPEQIVVGAGNDYLLILLQMLLEKNSVLAFENPTYTKAYHIFENLGYDTRLVGMDESGIKIKELEESGADIAYVMPSHQFPTGIVMPIGRRNELLKWSYEKEGRYLIEDDYDSEFRYRGKPIPALQGMDRKGKVIYIGTFSKAIAPTIRVSYMVLPEGLLEIYKDRGQLISSTVSRIDQQILEEFIRCGAFERHLNRMRKIYKGKHDFLLECLKPYQKRFRVKGDHAGSHILLCAKQNVDEESLRKKAGEAGIKIYCLSDYILQSEMKIKYSPTIILGYVGMEMEDIEQGISELMKVWENIDETDKV